MTPLFAKLNLKDHKSILVLDAPPSFELELAELRDVSVIRSVSELSTVFFAIIFVRTSSEIAAASSEVVPKAPGDPIIWFAYPKASSRRYRCEFNRDTGWDPLGDAGFEGVRQVAIDEDWSALRFRRVEHVKILTRAASRAGSAQGKARSRRP